MRKKIPSAAFTFAAAALMAQPAPQDPVIKVSVDLVQIDAAVTDAQGHPVAGLKPGDFEILEDGKPQRITSFSYVSDGAVRRVKTVAAPEVNPNFAPPPRPESIHRTIVLVADDLSFGPAEFPRARAVLRDFLDRQMKPDDLVSIMTTSGGMGALEQLTNDKRRLRAAIDRLIYSPSRNMFGGSITSETGGVHYDFEGDDRALAASRRPAFAAGSGSALGYAVQALRDMPGRKAVALLSAGLGASPAPIIEMANRASVVIYSLDMRGIVATWNAHLPPGFFASQGSLNALARGTGGLFFHETNDFAGALASAISDMSSYYLIGYRPPDGDFERVAGRTPFHRIQVKILRAGLNVRSRDGFAGVADSPAPSATDSEGELRRALDSPFGASALPLALNESYTALPEPGKPGRMQTTMRTTLRVDARGVKPEDIAEGRQRLVLDVLAGIWGGNDRPAALLDRRFTVEKTAEEMRRALEAGLALEIDLPIPRAGDYQLRAAVREPFSKQTGSATAFVQVPDLSGRILALSSVQLLAHNGDPELRTFPSGAALDYDCMIFGARREKVSGKPKLEIEVHLFRGPERIFTGRPIPLPVRSAETPVRAAGQIKLPDFLPPGAYTLELIARDRASGNGPQTAQWVDFILQAKE